MVENKNPSSYSKYCGSLQANRIVSPFNALVVDC